jgi:hypothetical protein
VNQIWQRRWQHPADFADEILRAILPAQQVRQLRDRSKAAGSGGVAALSDDSEGCQRTPNFTLGSEQGVTLDALAALVMKNCELPGN